LRRFLRQGPRPAAALPTGGGSMTTGHGAEGFGGSDRLVYENVTVPAPAS
jgi:hypothetical protein